jgi:hypothetical protein
MSIEMVRSIHDPAVDEAMTWPTRARALVVTDDASYSAGATLLMGIKALRKRIADVFDPHVKRAYDAHKALVREKTDADAPLTMAESIIKDSLVTFTQAQERVRRATQLRLEAEARAQAETRAMEEAAALETEGLATGDASLLEAAQTLIAQPVEVAPVYVAPATPAVSGISMRETWSAEVVDLSALVRHVAEHPEYLNLVIANQPALNALARSLKKSLSVPGVKAVATAGMAARI